MLQDSHVITNVQNGVAWIQLNRPKAINVLNAEMVEEIDHKLKEWKDNDNIALICIYGSGDKGFCAGGDMKDLYECRDIDVKDRAYRFFSKEYAMDLDIHTYPKPVLVYMDGIIMGGGVGVAIGGSYRLVTERTKWAMPETSIGFYPDVGASYFLNKLPGQIGLYLGLTGSVIGAASVLYAEVADAYIESGKWDDLMNAIQKHNWSTSTVDSDIKSVLNKHTSQVPDGSSLAVLQTKIDEHFSYHTVEQIMESLGKAAREEGDEWAKKTLHVLMSKSPIALKITLKQLVTSQALSLNDCFTKELKLSMSMMRNDDFYEGVRSVLVDKDHHPKWEPNTLEDVTDERIQSFMN
ncbi:enoyl-CoA hydratase/isomerase family protein [Virgibacillus byunsanensis]|uniref:3-hydroxyisobutyryl-CoA hydrolase n=1 Tax=Virgibacillus byunsanensis TaxID=570945 RepID=A0ABW3LQ28_9BACI